MTEIQSPTEIESLTKIESVTEIDSPTDIELSTENNDKIICKYCLEPILKRRKRINPCNCTQPICLECLSKQLKITGNRHCEICRVDFNMNSKLIRKIDKCSVTIIISNEDRNEQSNGIELIDNTRDGVNVKMIAAIFCILFIVILISVAVYLIIIRYSS